ncbi:MAG: hypothetical protein OXE84_03390 [Rhodobacteraceae bacterium]|nr:hypothetical protein [Paracoccaceae bacterium]
MAMNRLLKFPLVAKSYLAAGLSSMLGPAMIASLSDDHHIARTFFYCGLLVVVFAIILGIATSNIPPQRSPFARLIELILIFVTLPVLLAVPLHFAIGPLDYIDVYFEMLSCLTTTGTSALMTNPEFTNGLPVAVHFWRAQVAWMGGLLIWLLAAEIMAPLGISGFELADQRQESTNRLPAFLARISVAPVRAATSLSLSAIYIGLTFTLWLTLVILGEAPVSSLIAAFSTLSTSGITESGGYSIAGNSLPAEVVIGMFLLLAISRLAVPALRRGGEAFFGGFDREVYLALLLVMTALLCSLFFNYQNLAAARSWPEFATVAKSLWGTIFSTLSFLSTSGFQSLYWDKVTDSQPSEFLFLCLLGITLVGGGVATTAGGIKLMRVASIVRFSAGELGRLAHPSLITPETNSPRGMRGERGALACIFMILFLAMLALLVLSLSLFGIELEKSMVLAVAALSSTGPLVDAATGTTFDYAELPAVVKLLLCVAMIAGRLELLALLALVAPSVNRSTFGASS